MANGKSTPSNFTTGARAVRVLLLAIEASNRRSIEAHGDISLAENGALLERAARGAPEHVAGFHAAMAEYLSYAMEGSYLVVKKWRPIAAGGRYP